MPENLITAYQYYTKADMSKFLDTGYDAPTMTLEEAIKDYYQNYLAKEFFLGDK
jgi:ADP-L-glycero-D-manno-heptose 6-epimerase